MFPIHRSVFCLATHSPAKLPARRLANSFHVVLYIWWITTCTSVLMRRRTSFVPLLFLGRSIPPGTWLQPGALLPEFPGTRLTFTFTGAHALRYFIPGCC